MSSRKSRKSRSKRGSRTHGGGSHRKSRHSGNKGGKGLAGSHKHHWRKIKESDPKHFGKYGFKRPQKVQRQVKTINVGELDEYAEELLEEGIAEKDGEKIVIDVDSLNIDKVLGGGKVTRPLKVLGGEFSKSAERKLEESGGSAVVGED
ncbi:50S ribosomal protein L15 [candidate division MSBL1 archaeon SCGC-AAA259D14]|uniref:Large ribosomal subunit protein uL15 n=1 Tax=candidate division MSBL1 archaeon SCGC-AAA259D14 TaxID=1698261 RepID=A0A133U7E9_9EURY|nr:50S ribosomal protein L15 [candidate division MSBL1 archaeon SCGC-AAA259D14]